MHFRAGAEKVVALAALSCALAACNSQTATLPHRMTPSSLADAYRWTPRSALPAPTDLDYAALMAHRDPAARTIAYFTGSIKSPLDGKTYAYAIAGNDPKKSLGPAKISYVPIVLVLTFADGTVLDPRRPACNDSVSVQDRVFDGPAFVATPTQSNGVKLGWAQLGAAAQRAEFWKVLKSRRYGTEFVAAGPPAVVHANAPAGSATVAGVCAGSSHRIGEIPLTAYYRLIKPIAFSHAMPAQVPMILTYNAFETDASGCCWIGYHAAYRRTAGTQVLATSAYNDAGIFKQPIQDIHIWTHELGELLNDPFLSNATPAWGHVGQVSGCQSNLEVGDPLTGTALRHTYRGFTYHPQELAFFSWFFRTPSIGTGDKYSFEGTFDSTQPLCR